MLILIFFFFNSLTASLIIPQNQLSTAYGMMQAIQNLGLGLATMGAGWIVDLKGYIMLENIFLVSLSSKFMNLVYLKR